MECLRELEQHCDVANYARTCLYLMSCSAYLPEPEDALCLEVAHAIYIKARASQSSSLPVPHSESDVWVRRQKTALERGTDPKFARRACSSRHGLSG